MEIQNYPKNGQYIYKQDKINAGNSLADEYQAGTGLPIKIIELNWY